MSNTKSITLQDLQSIIDATEDALNEWQGNGNLKFPDLVSSVAIKLGLDEKQAREADGIIRFYVRRNENFHVTRGQKGGIMRSSDRDKKLKAKETRAALKAEMKAKIDEKVSLPVDDDTSEDSEQDIEDQVFGDEE